MTTGEKSGDYGEALRGDERTAVWASQTDSGGTDAGRGAINGDNKVALTVGAVLIVALVLLCFRLAYTGIKESAKNTTAGRYDATDTPAPVAFQPGAPAVAAPRAAQPAPLPTPRPVTMGFAPPASPAPVPERTLFASEKERERVAELLRECRVAFDVSGELAPQWSATVAGVRPRAETTLKASKSDEASETPVTAAPSVPTAKEWDAMDTQMEAIATSVAFATRPALYPVTLQNAAAELGGEMRTYLQTTRIALGQADATERAALQGRADAHRQAAAQLLARLESAVQTPSASKRR